MKIFDHFNLSPHLTEKVILSHCKINSAEAKGLVFPNSYHNTHFIGRETENREQIIYLLPRSQMSHAL